MRRGETLKLLPNINVMLDYFLFVNKLIVKQVSSNGLEFFCSSEIILYSQQKSPIKFKKNLKLFLGMSSFDLLNLTQIQNFNN